MLTPLVLGDLLTAVGVPEAVAIVAVAVLAVWHLRSATQMLASAGFAAKVVGVVGVIVVAAWAGLIPGVSLSVALDRVGAFLGGIWQIIETGVTTTLEAAT